MKDLEKLKAELSPEAYYVTCQHGTERPFSSPLNAEKRDGNFHCIVCGENLFDAAAKFDSGTGWPSFFEPATETAVGVSIDKSHGMVRSEVHCKKCEAHLGHVFPDGPAPTGLRFCINGAALKFAAEKE